MKNVVKQVDEALIYTIAVSIILLALITSAMIFLAIRYRKSKNPIPKDIRGSVALELTWIIIPTVIALSMFYIGWQSFLGLRAVPPDAIPISVTAMEFTWSFSYPNQKESEALMVVPAGRPIKLTLTSLDVIHSFYLPAFRIKMDAVKNMKTYTWFYADKIGDYTIFCAEYCGVGHADMNATLRIVPEPEYLKWLNKK